MAEPHPTRSRAKAWAVEIDAARRRAGLLWPDWLAEGAAWLARLLSQWAAAEVAPGRLAPWLPVGFGFGIVVYFAADREPAAWAAAGAAFAGVVAAYLARRNAVSFAIALGFAAVAAGFATATLQTARVAHPVLAFPLTASVSGFVETREERARSDRIVVRVSTIEARRLGAAPQRLRVAVRKGTAPAVGSFVSFKAHLAPPLAPLRPGGYDFAREMYFSSLGASGFVLGRVKTVPPPQAPGLWLRYASLLDGLREGINRRIHALLPGDRGSIASALITGKRNAISDPVSDAFYVSSLAHVLAISGYHMAVVAGIVFFFIRAGLALVPSLASRYPIKKWAAAAALVTAAFYLVLSGSSVSTQRAFIMIGIVLVGVMLDRPALTFRTIAIAAFVVLLFTPEAVVHPSFQMSFAAALALIAAYQYGLPWRANADTSHGARVALWGGREIAGIVLASVVAGLATTPYSAFHFHRLAPYGVLANLLAMPVISAWVMPMGILGVLTLPFGFDAVFWKLMGDGVDWMIAVVLWVAHLPGAVGHIHAFGTGPLLLATAGLLLLCLLRSPLRWSGAVLALAACLWVMALPRPDVLIAADGEAAAVRGRDGKLAILHSGRDTFAIKEWLMADGDGRNPKDVSLHDGVACDAIGCVGRLTDGRPVSFALSVEAFAEDCALAAVVISPREAPGACHALLIDRKAWRENGAMALRRVGDRFALSAARPAGYERPWTRGPRDVERTSTPARRAAPDATPKTEDLEAGD
ncbi:MAG: ComEC/Rec2 family competence protein [Pseudolabrys sp.]